LIDIVTVGERLGVSVRYVRRLVAERRIPYVKFGDLLRFDPAEVDKWVDRARVWHLGRARRNGDGEHPDKSVPCETPVAVTAKSPRS